MATTEGNVYDSATIERRILEIVDGRYGLVTLNNLQRLYKDHHGHKLDHAALGFGQLLDLIRSLRGLEAPAHGSKGNRKIRRAGPPRIFQHLPRAGAAALQCLSATPVNRRARWTCAEIRRRRQRSNPAVGCARVEPRPGGGRRR